MSHPKYLKLSMVSERDYMLSHGYLVMVPFYDLVIHWQETSHNSGMFTKPYGVIFQSCTTTISDLT